MGKRLARYLGYDPNEENVEDAVRNDEHEDRWVAAMGHFSVIIVLWGLLAPAGTWVLQGKRSAFWKFQSIQTTVFQAAVNLFYLGAVVLSLVGMIPLFAMTGLEGDPNQSSPTAMLGLIIFLLCMLVAFGILF